MLDSVDSVWHFWWLIFPLSGVIGGAVRTVAAANERRAERRMERALPPQAAGQDRGRRGHG
jgi:hypothetical protein